MMMRKRKNIIYAIAISLFIVTSSFVPMLHKYYFSLTEVNIDTKKHSMDVSCKLFMDDLELELNKLSTKKIDLSMSVKNKEVEELLFTYLNKNFKINVGGKLQNSKFVGYEIENDAVWCYMETANFKGKGTVSIMNTLLYDSFPEQSNLMNVKWDGNNKSMKLSNPDKLAEFEF